MPRAHARFSVNFQYVVGTMAPDNEPNEPNLTIVSGDEG